MKMFGKNVAAVLVLCVLASACAPSTVRTRDDFVLEDGHKILFMTPDIELSELTVGGLLEPNAAWTENAKRYVTAAIEGYALQHRVSTVHYNAFDQVFQNENRTERVLRLHETVGQSILTQYNPHLALPTKSKTFDWTLGDQVEFLRQATEADYALFVFMRDSYASSGRVGLIIGAAILGITMTHGVQSGFASLVDLNNGHVVWFNHFARGIGDLRNPEDAASAIELLLEGSTA